MLEELARINEVNDLSLKEERLSVFMIFIFENEHSHKYVDPNMEKIRRLLIDSLISQFDTRFTDFESLRKDLVLLEYSLTAEIKGTKFRLSRGTLRFAK